jgi:hypothetical protein
VDKELINKLFTYKDGNLYWKSKFSKYSSIKIGQEAGYIDTEGYKRTKINKKLYGNHQLIYLMFYGFIPLQIDHANQNKLDNTIENLRIVTKSQNQHNKTIQKNNTSGVKGVSWYKRLKKWQVQIMVNKKPLHFGHFADLELAELVAIEARSKYHGKFASW